MTAEATYLAVARFRKPHGLKGEVLVFPLTDRPDEVFVSGRTLTPVDERGVAVGDPIRVAKARRYQRHWLLAFEGIEDRSHVEMLQGSYLGVAEEELEPPADDEMYVYEIPGATVTNRGEIIGVARNLLDAPGGRLLAVEVEGREILLPFRAPLLQGVDRVRRILAFDLPDGLLEV